MYNLQLTKKQLETLTNLLDLSLKVNGLTSLGTVVELYNVVLSAQEIKKDEEEK